MSDTSSATAKKRQAKHELLDQTGAVIEDLAEEQAHGMKYTLLANGESVEYQFGQHPDADRMLAIFGAKTLSTNETSQARNGKLAAGPDQQIAAVRDRFALLQSGIWVDRTREGGFALNLDAAAGAIADVAIAEGKVDGNDQAAVDAFVAARKAKLESDEAFRSTIRRGASGGHTGLTDAYTKRVGKATVSVDDMFA